MLLLPSWLTMPNRFLLLLVKAAAAEKAVEMKMKNNSIADQRMIRIRIDVEKGSHRPAAAIISKAAPTHAAITTDIAP
jgi:hypothetical protein